MKIISRAEWGAKHGDGGQAIHRPVPRVVVHHSQSPDVAAGASEAAVAAAIRGIERHHVGTNGWKAIGYNFLIDQDGRVWEGRGWGRVGAHSPGVNAESIGTCFLIDGRAKAPTDAAWKAAADLIRAGIAAAHIIRSYTVSGHRDHRATTCPGDHVYSGLARLRELAPQAAVPASPAPAAAPASPLAAAIVADRWHARAEVSVPDVTRACTVLRRVAAAAEARKVPGAKELRTTLAQVLNFYGVAA